MQKPERHIFVLWSKARPFEREILADISRSFAIVETLEIAWPRLSFPWRLHRLYGKSVFSMFRKMLRSGGGKFLVVLVDDPSPRPSASGSNLNTGKAKSRYRDLAGGNWRVHASDTEREAEENLKVLLEEF